VDFDGAKFCCADHMPLPVQLVDSDYKDAARLFLNVLFHAVSSWLVDISILQLATDFKCVSES